jgi:polar amino acid transport system substrate-binding protein
LRQFLLLISVFAAIGFTAHAKDPVAVKVGGYSFPPFVDVSTGNTAGITLDLIKALNRFQKQYRFEFVLTSPKRRYHAFEKESYDIIFFESVHWGWEELPVDISKVFLTGGEVYITKAAPGKDQSYFNSLVGKSKAGILGYHYGFADFNASQDTLKHKYQMSLYTDHELIIDKVVSGQIDIGVVTASYLSYHLKKDPALASRLLVSDRYDQHYRHTVLVRKGADPDVDEINQLLNDMGNSGILDRIWEKYGIPDTSVSDVSTPPLVIGVSFAIPPYVIKDIDQGIELEILQEAFSVTGKRIRIEYLPLARTFTLLGAGKIDGVINIKKGMLDNVFYSDNVITFQNCAISLAKKNYPDDMDLSFLRDKSVIAFQRAPTILGEAFAAVVAGNDRYEEVAQQDRQVFRLFLERDADLIIMERQIFNYYRKKAMKDRTVGQKAAQPVTFHYLFLPTDYRFAFKDKTVRDAFNLGLKTIRDNKTYSRIVKKYEKLMSLQ